MEKNIKAKVDAMSNEEVAKCLGISNHKRNDWDLARKRLVEKEIDSYNLQQNWNSVWERSL
jgi:hypothetical protein